MTITDGAPRTRTATESIDAGVALARADYPSLLVIAGAALVVQSPLIIASSRTMAARQWGAFAAVYLLRVALGGIFSGAGVAAASEGYLGRRMDAGRSFGVALRRATTLARVAVNVHVAVALGLIALVFPGLIATARFFAAEAAVVVEQCGLKEALDRSRQLSVGNERRILGAILPAAILLSALGWSGTTVATWLGARPLVALLTGQMVSMALWPVYYALVVVLYYDARIRNEAFDIAIMLDQIPEPAA